MHRFVYLAYMLMVASAGVTFVFLEDVETQFGLPSWGVGLIASLGFLTAVISAIVISPIGDRGNLTGLGVAGFITSILGNITFALAGDLWTLAGSRALTGIGAGIFAVVARKALIGEATDDSGEKLGMLISAAVAGFIGGPAIGSFLSEFGGIGTPYYVLSVLLALIAAPTMHWIRSTPVATSAVVGLSTARHLVKKPGVRAALFTQVAVFFNIGVFDATVDEYLTDLGVSNAGVGVVIVIVGSPLLFIPAIVGRFVDKSPRPADIMLLALFFFVPIVITLGLWTGVVVFVSLAFVQTALESAIFPASARVIVNETGAEESATGTGLLDAAGNLAAAVSALVAPIAYDLTNGPLGSFGMSGTFAGLMLLFARWNIGRRDGDRRPSARPVPLPKT